MNYPPHGSMNDATHTISPDQGRQTVGNSSRFTRDAERVQVLEKDDDFALNAMWAAYQRARLIEAENLPEIPTGLVQSSWVLVLALRSHCSKCEVGEGQRIYTGHEYDREVGLNYMRARYQDPSRGQFLSQDPAARENPNQFLADPQQLNSYSYARNNPITQKDPDGRFVPQVIALGFLYGGLANVAFQGYTGNINSFGDFANAFGQGGVVTAASIINPFLGGGAAATLSLAESARTNGNITWESGVSAVAQGGVTWATGGFLKGLPGVPGVQATKIFGGNYITGAHGVRYAQEAAFGFGTDVFHHNVQQITQSLLNFYAPQTTGGRSTGGGGNINQLSQSVINYANNPGANLSDPGFVAGIRAINEYNNSLTTPSKK